MAYLGSEREYIKGRQTMKYEERSDENVFKVFDEWGQKVTEKRFKKRKKVSKNKVKKGAFQYHDKIMDIRLYLRVQTIFYNYKVGTFYRKVCPKISQVYTSVLYRSKDLIIFYQ